MLPGAPLIESGPYRLMRHPNYVVVAGELVLAPLALGLPIYALVLQSKTAVASISIRKSGTARAETPIHVLAGGFS